MPPTPIPVGFGIATVKHSRLSDGQVEVITFGFSNAGASSAFAAATSISSIWQADFPVAGLADTYEYSGVNALIETASGQQSYTATAAVAGTRSTPSPSSAVAARITKQTLFSGRKHRGRMYLPNCFIEESQISDGGVLSGGAVSALQSAMTTFLGDLVTANYGMVLLHRDLSTPNNVLSLEVRNNAGTQRRRQRLS